MGSNPSKVRRRRRYVYIAYLPSVEKVAVSIYVDTGEG